MGSSGASGGNVKARGDAGEGIAFTPAKKLQKKVGKTKKIKFAAKQGMGREKTKLRMEQAGKKKSAKAKAGKRVIPATKRKKQKKKTASA